MSVTFNVAETPARLCRADRRQRQHPHPGQGDPPRVPPRRGRSVQLLRVKRSRDRIQSLGFFQENLEIEQTQGSAPDRVILVDRRRGEGDRRAPALGRLLEPRALPAQPLDQPAQLQGQGPGPCAPAINYSSYSKSVELGFTEPYVFDRNIALGFDIYPARLFELQLRQQQPQHHLQAGHHRRPAPRRRAAHRIYVSSALRYGLNLDDVTLDEATFFTDPDGTGPLPAVCDPLLAGRYLCDAIGKRTTSSIGYSLLYDTTRQPPSADARPALQLNQDFAGLGGDVKYLRTRANAAKYLAASAAASSSRLAVEGGYIHSFENDRGAGAGSGPPDRPLLPRRAADPRLRHSRRRPARPAHPVSTPTAIRSPTASRSPTTRSAAGPIISAAPSSRSRSARASRSWAFGRPSSSTPAPCSGSSDPIAQPDRCRADPRTIRTAASTQRGNATPAADAGSARPAPS